MPQPDSAAVRLIRAPGRTEVTGLACEGEQPLMATVGTLETLESGSGGGGVEPAEGRAVIFFVISEEALPTVVNDLPEG